MTSFETSALLITFVILGKYLECRAKSATSKALSELSRLSPSTATLVAIQNTTDDVSTNLTVASNHHSNTSINSTANLNTNSTTTMEETPVPEEVIPLILLQLNDILLVRPGETS